MKEWYREGHFFPWDSDPGLTSCLFIQSVLVVGTNPLGHQREDFSLGHLSANGARFKQNTGIVVYENIRRFD